MRYSRLFILSLVCLSWGAPAADFTVKGSSAMFGRSLPTGVVVIAPLRARLKPTLESKPVIEFQLGDQLSVFSQTARWYGIRVQLPQGSVLAAWVEKTGLQIKAQPKPKAPARPIVSPVPQRVIPPPPQVIEPSPVRSAAKSVSNRPSGRNELGLMGGRAFDVHRYGVDQNRMGLYFRFKLNDRFSLDLPLSYAMGGAFDVMAAGVGVQIAAYTLKDVTFYGRVGMLGERIYDSDQSFYAATVEPAIGVRWSFLPRFGLSFEPGAQVMVYNRVDIPMNVRAQALLKLWTVW